MAQIYIESKKWEKDRTKRGPGAFQTMAAYHRVDLGRLDKLQGKAFTHFCEVEWWRTLMVECETVFFLFDPTSDSVLQMGLQALPIN